MNGVQNRKVHNVEKPFPGCLGRMVNLFELTTGVTGNRLLTDKPHHNGSPLSRSQSDVARIRSLPFGDQIEDKLIVPDLTGTSSNKKINGTPIKMLIDQEMSKEVDSKRSPPNVVAKLMGLEALPEEDPNLALQRSHRKDYSRQICGHSEMPFKWQLEDRLVDKEILHEGHKNPEQTDYKDIHEIWRQTHRKSHVRDNSPERGRWTEDVDEKKMALIRQKFMEVKRLSTDTRLRQSKEFNEGLEVLNSNKDLLLRLLYLQNLYEFQSPPSPETKRIRVLKPSKMVDNDKPTVRGKNDKQIKRLPNVGQASMWDKRNPGYSPTGQKADEYPVQPTRIVVLKPSSGKTHEIKAVASSTPTPQHMQNGNFFQGPGDEDVLDPRKVAKEITQQVEENVMGHQRDEALYSSVFSNGYTGDESSFNKSDIEYPAGNFSDLEVMSPSPRHSWDYINRCGSPFSSSSFSRASCSPESSVCREAKKRLYERWAIMASNKGPQEQRHLRRSSTLGEMLALSDTKKSVTSEAESPYKEQESRESTSCSSKFNEERHMNGSPTCLPRSKSLPVSSTVYETGLSVEVCDFETGKARGSKELAKAKSIKSSFKGKVTSLFFSRNKTPARENYDLSPCKDDSLSTITETSVSLANSPENIRDNASQSFSSGAFGECSLPSLCESSGKNYSDSGSKGQRIISVELGLAVSKPTGPGISRENQDQPSPISVLEPAFEEYENTAQESFHCMKAGTWGTLKSNLIDKSPPIESIARTLSWDGSCAEVASPYPLKPLMVSLDTKVEEQDWLVFVQKLLSAAGLHDKVQCDSFYTRWHSHDSPLDPSLRANYALSDKEPLPEAKRRQRRSNQKLIFDCVNTALGEITGFGSQKNLTGNMCHGRLLGASPLLVDVIMAQMKELSGGMRCVWGDCGDSNSLVVEGFVRREVVGRGWVELMGLEMDNLGDEIEGKLLEELVDEAVADLTGRAC